MTKQNLVVALASSLLLLSSAQAARVVLDEGFESYSAGATQVNYFVEQNCKSITDCSNCTTPTPLSVSTAQARSGKNSLRFERRTGDQTLTGSNYCGYRNEVSGHEDPFSSIGEHVWIGFSFFPTAYWKDKWSADNVHVFQFKNVDAGGSGNQLGSIRSHNVGGIYKYEVSGLGDVAEVKINQWNDIVLHLHYATSGGTVEAWINGIHKVAQPSFPDKNKCYVKFGTYSDDLEPNSSHVGYYDDIRVVEDASSASHYHEIVPGQQAVPVSSARTDPWPRSGKSIEKIYDLQGRVLKRSSEGGSTSGTNVGIRFDQGHSSKMILDK